MNLNDAGINLIKTYEGLRLNAYRCAAGIVTIGYGHTNAAGSPMITMGDRITPDEAELILRNDLKRYERGVNNALMNHVAFLNENQYSALVSLCYNIGPGNFHRSSVVRLIKQGRIKAAADKILLWNRAKGRILKGLVRRREAERALYLS